MINILIIGQGLAGTILGLHCRKYGIPFHIVDDPNQVACSNIAAGLVNPITGINMLKTWLADETFSYLFSFYRATEKLLGINIFHEKDIYRPFANISQQNDFAFLSDKKLFKNYLHSYANQPQLEKYISNPYGGVYISQTGWLDFVKLINSSRLLFKRRKRFTPISVHKHNVKLNKGLYQIVDVDDSTDSLLSQTSFSHIILANGLQAKQWDDFKHLTFNPVKGEILTIKTDNVPKFILNRGIFCIPISEDKCRIGATYDREFKNEKPSEKGKQELVLKANQLFNFKYKITLHQAGIRPATTDRKPFLGWSKKNRNIGIFSGFGSKGGSLIPYFADYWLKTDSSFGIGHKKISKKIDIERCKIVNY